MQTVVKESSLSVSRKAEAAVIVGLLIAVILVTALAPTVIKQSDNARAEVAVATNVNQGGAAIFGLMPLMWAVMGVAIVAGAVIKLL